MDMSRRPPDIAPAASGIPLIEAPDKAPDVSSALPQLDLSVLSGAAGRAADRPAERNDITAPAERRPAAKVAEVAQHSGATVVQETTELDTTDGSSHDIADQDDVPVPAEAASERAQALGAALTMRATRFGVTIPKDIADRAGQVLAGEPITAPLNTPEVSETRPTEDPPTADGAVKSSEDPESGAKGVDTATSTETKQERRWAPGQLREIVHGLHQDYADGGHDLRAELSPRLQEALDTLLDPEIPNITVAAERLGVKASHVSRMAQRLIEKGVTRAQELNVNVQLPEPQGGIPHKRNDSTVGGTLSGLRQRLGMPLNELVERTGLSLSVLTRFFNDEVHPAAQRILNPVLRALDIPEDQAAGLKERYEAARTDRAETRAAARQRAMGDRPPRERRADTAPNWAPGQIREALRALNRSLAKEGGIGSTLPSRLFAQRQVAELLVNSDLTNAQIAKQLGVKNTSEVARLAGYALRNALQTVPQESLPPDLPQPATRHKVRWNANR